MDYPKVSIILLNWNGKEDTLSCIDSLLKINYPDFNIVLIDNGSNDGSVEVFKEKFSNNSSITLIFNKNNLGFTGGCNIGIKHVLRRKASHILILNNDVLVNPDFLWILVNSAQKDKRIGMVSPKIYFYKESRKIYFAGGRLNKHLAIPEHIGLGEMDKGQHDEVKDCDFLTGCCLLVKREVVERVGSFDEAYNNAFFEDIDLCTRAKGHNYKLIYQPRSVVWHKHSKSIGYKSPNYYYHMSKNALLFARKNLNAIFFILFFYSLFYIL